MPDEDRAGVAYAGEQRLGIFHRELEVLRRDLAGDGTRLVEITHLHQRAATLERRRNNVLALHAGQQPLHAGRDCVDEIRDGRQENCACVFVVLGLGKQIHREPVGTGAAGRRR